MLYLATSNGVACVEREGDWRVTGRALPGQNITSVIAREGLVLAGTRKGIFHSEGGSSPWHETRSGPDIKHIRWMEWRADQPGSALAGTEPAGIFYTSDGGQTWKACPEVAELRDRFGWMLPYSPEAGCVR
ncbi:MAG: hypothetical protein EHM21_04275, partial [Chloroflexi bacterium]